ncbi:hypothetical protein [Alkalibacillus aidingensis]|uniref:hypothetical protein n=1 Tax=Alkalibacillus aidingensis TaxID=2747607 RepID=UPI002948BFA2|nr:hypothetical protein [Alkalibacillus aidingensis]
MNLQENLILLKTTKGYSDRYVPFQDRIKDQLEKYLKLRGVVNCNYLFITLENEQLAKRQRITKYGKQ